ncbi:MAG TPA: hypothetical protein ENJ46_05300, partial [Hellea balneolensis]|nr:hypothetical protein [Hellea balneolensis]
MSKIVFCMPLLLGLSACVTENEAGQKQAVLLAHGESQNADTIPQAQLGDNVIPTAYHIDLKMDPRDDGFTGTVDIDVD